MNGFLRIFLFSSFVLFASANANAWTYTCPPQSISHRTLNDMSVTTAYGFVTLRMHIDGQPITVPTLLQDGDDAFKSHDDDIELTLNPLLDEQSGTMRIDLKVKSMKIKGSLTCSPL